MRRRVTFLLFLPAIALMPILVVAFGACSNQGEGERCSPEAGNAGADDCESGLVCVRTNNADAVYRCCPSDRTQATTSACALPGTVDANSSVPEAAPAGEASTDAADDGSDGPISSQDGAILGDESADAPADGALDALDATSAPDAPGVSAADVTSEAARDAASEAADARALPDGSDATAD